MGDIMRNQEFERVLERIAMDNHTTIEEVRKEMIIAMKDGQSCPDPVVRARWARIPKKGNELTLEEFVEFLLNETKRSLS